MMLTTTFTLLHEARACKEGYERLAKAQGGIAGWGKDTPIPLARIVETNGLDDALWCLQAVTPGQKAERDKLARLFACDCAERVLPLYEAKYPNDSRPRKAIETARRFADGKATREELAAARAAPAFAADAASYAAATAAAATAYSADAASYAAATAAAASYAAATAAAATATAYVREREWQTARFLAALEGK